MLLGLTAMMQASPLTAGESLSRAAAPNVRMAAPSRFTTADLVYTAKDANNEAALYVFARQGEGFLITSADDVASPVLAYSSTGTFANAQMPDNLRWWLGEYAREIAYAKANNIRPLKELTRPQRAPIAPLVSTRWNQGAPYNDSCPLMSGQRTYTGCVATAMAQVVKHHNWPERGIGSNTYTWNGQPLSMDFSKQVYDWAHMTDTYGDNSTSQEKAAVAQLMLACGISVNMGYGLSGSGAMSSVVPGALIDNFGYGKCTTQISRDECPLLQWEEYIYRSLAANAPCYYSGQNLSVGHAFVCDGYSSDGYFHFNWGWGGVSDGYFRLTALDPSSQGIGGSNNGYNIYQSVILNALPSNVCNTGLAIFENTVKVTPDYDTVNNTLSLSGNFRNLGAAAVEVEMGLRVRNMETGAETIYGTGKLQRVNPRKVIGNITVTVPALANGYYEITPMVNSSCTLSEKVWDEVLMPLGEPTIAYMERSADGIQFAFPEYGLLEAQNLTLQTPLYNQNNYKVTMKVKNPLTTEVYEYFVVGLLQGNSLVEYSSPYAIDLMGGESEDVTYISSFDAPAGSYDLAVIQLLGNNAYLISDRVPVTLSAAPSPVRFNVSNLAVTDAENVDASNIAFNFDLNVTRGYFCYPMTAYIAPENGGAIISGETYETLFIDGQNTKHLSYTISSDALEVNKRYMLAIFCQSKQLAYTTFKVTTLDVNSIDTDSQWQFDGTKLTAPSTLESAALYTLQGMKAPVEIVLDGNTATFDATALPAGVYLLRAATPTAAKTLRIIVK